MTATTDILQDFRSTLRGLDASALEILDDSRLARALYSSDASIYRVVPTAIAHPRSTDELSALVTAASQVGLPITARGAGTTCAGNAVGAGLVIDTSAHLNRILSLDPQARTAVVEPGVVQDWLQHAGVRHRLRFGPDPSTSTRCTIGGMIGNNACGPRALGYGRTGDNLVDVDLLTADGHVTTLRRGDFAVPFTQRLVDLTDASLATIRTEFATFSRQVSGYSMEWLLPERGRNFPAFIAGTEATLGIVTRATVQLVREAAYGMTVALGYPSMPEAADAVTALLPFSPVACEVRTPNRRRGFACRTPGAGLAARRRLDVRRAARGRRDRGSFASPKAGCRQRMPGRMGRLRSWPGCGSVENPRGWCGARRSQP